MSGRWVKENRQANASRVVAAFHQSNDLAARGGPGDPPAREHSPREQDPPASMPQRRLRRPTRALSRQESIRPTRTRRQLRCIARVKPAHAGSCVALRARIRHKQAAPLHICNSTASYTPIASPVRNRTARLGPDRRAGGCRITPHGRCATPSRDRSEAFGAKPVLDHGLQLIDKCRVRGDQEFPIQLR